MRNDVLSTCQSVAIYRHMLPARFSAQVLALENSKQMLGPLFESITGLMALRKFTDSISMPQLQANLLFE